MTTVKAHMQANIKREVTKIYKQEIGKGPEQTEVYIHDRFVYIKFIGAFSQIEESLMVTESGRAIVRRIREELTNVQTDYYVPVVEEIVQSKMKKVSYMLDKEKDIVYVFMLFADIIEQNGGKR